MASHILGGFILIAFVGDLNASILITTAHRLSELLAIRMDYQARFAIDHSVQGVGYCLASDGGIVSRSRARFDPASVENLERCNFVTLRLGVASRVANDACELE